MAEADADQLKRAFEGLHRCAARLVESVPVAETQNGETMWEGVVHVFELTGHPAASRAFAWSSAIEGSDRRRLFAVLQEGPIMAPVDAVRAALLAQQGESRE
jgi:hypothetical protein